ncbi:ATP-dependent DNA helicase RecG [Limnochorda pilosa]|uniref:ATP-dependent DNA helicase RecG n=1 Tax=Limnochorda pilosa TaxID=1555112 RepID=UPI00082F63DD|nr:ATP-dependent DNA helicase RecG [Limnochorda pilosa]
MTRLNQALRASIRTLKGVGPVRAGLLERLGVLRIWDLLALPPRRYLDFRREVGPAQVRPGETVTVRGNLGRLQRRPLPNRPRVVQVEARLEADGTSLPLTWYVHRAQAPALRFPPVGTCVLASGEVRSLAGRLQMVNPVLERAEDAQVAGRLLPVYPLTQGLSQGVMRRLAAEALDRYGALVEEFLPEEIRRATGLPALDEAIRNLHRPEDPEAARLARRRLAFDELFLWTYALERIHAARRSREAPAFAPPGTLARRFLDALPFAPTPAQRAAMDELDRELMRPHPMRRLLQGDVGSGKTLVAAYALLRAVENGFQATMAVPTGVLARQQQERLAGLFRSLGVRVLRLTGTLPDPERSQVEAELASGQPLVVVGTHVLGQGIGLARMGLVVVDEEQRFGVRQREALAAGGVHQLWMTATPVPRTLALTLYGDLDVTTLRDLPPGRHPVDTRWIPERNREQVYRFLRARAEAGERGFILFPAIEADGQAQALVEQVRSLARGPLAGIPIGVVHGRMPDEERWSTLRAFQEGEVPVLAATTVVEVGVDVPEATVIVVEGADRFGLSQLHQLRGRVARSARPSFCFLLATPRTPQARGRLNAMRTLADGFAIAEADLRLRGQGELLGEAQSGSPEWKLASFPEDEALLWEAREQVEAYLRRAGPAGLRDGSIAREVIDRALPADGAR